MQTKTHSRDWYKLSCENAVRELNSNARYGLSAEEAAVRLAEHGPNELKERGGKSPWLIVWEQLASTMVFILILAAVVSVILGDYKDAATILAIVVLNTVLGYVQEYRAERAMSALKRMSTPNIRVRRNGHLHEISARDLVPGDVVQMETGSIVAADCRLLETANLRVQEAALTGESEPVEKTAHMPAGGQNVTLADRHNMVYMGTTVTYGRGEGLVVETGMSTELGHIASMIQRVDREPTPLQRRLDGLGKRLALIALIIVALVFALGVLRGEDLRLMFLTAVSMAVAAVPEGLPAVVTIALALGAQRMLKRRALIRKLPAVETLGSVTAICSDKTGTLTQNRMTVTVLDVAGHRIDLSTPLEEKEYNDTDDIAEEGERTDSAEMLAGIAKRPALALLLAGGALCNDAKLHEQAETDGHLHATGDPTEGALVVASAELGLWKNSLEEVLPRVAEVPFDSDRKLMTTLHALPPSSDGMPEGLKPIWGYALAEALSSRPKTAGSAHTAGTAVGNGSRPSTLAFPYIAFTKGAVDSLLAVCDRALIGERIEHLCGELRHRILMANDKLAANGMRVLGMAFRLWGEARVTPIDMANDDCVEGAVTSENWGGERDVESGLIFLGMVGMVDPARPEAQAAVQTCKHAGIRLVMITGDHPLTAGYIARQLGLVEHEDEGDEAALMLTGQELDSLSTEELQRIVEGVAVYARVSPEHKLSIVQALQNRGHIVAMTGDGVNDAPALKKADIGIAMGISGTDVSKEAAEMVLVDDNFATIVAAIEEGRVIYENIRKFVRYLMTTNSAEIWVMLLAPFLGMPMALLPVQILWINLVTDGLPALALAVEPAERDVMSRPPNDPKESLLGRGMLARILWTGLLIGLVTLAAGYWYWQAGSSNWQTVLFTVLTLSQMANVLAARSDHQSLFRIGLLSNRPLLGAVGLTLALQVLVIYLPAMQELFGTAPLGLLDIGIAFVLSTTVLWVDEAWKWLAQHRASRPPNTLPSVPVEDLAE